MACDFEIAVDASVITSAFEAAVHFCCDGVISVIRWSPNLAVVDCGGTGRTGRTGGTGDCGVTGGGVTVTVWLVIAAGPPLLLAVWPVKSVPMTCLRCR